MSNLVKAACGICEGNNTRQLFSKGDFNIVKCRNCGLIYVDPRLPDERLQERYSKDYYAGGNGPPLSKRLTYQDFFIKAKKHSFSGKDLLDVGCGTGEFLRLACQHGWQGKGAEPSKYASDYARENYGTDVYSGRLRDIGFSASYFDIITMWDCIEHLPDPKRELLEINRILKKDGMLAISTVNFSGLSQRLFGPSSNQFCPEEHLNFFTSATISRLLRDCGFTPVEVKTQYLYLFNLIALYHRLLKGKSKQDISQDYRSFLNRIEFNRILPSVIRIANSFLNVINKGDQIVVYAIKTKGFKRA